jgi:nucleotide-binding universal stress UspA family protein
MGPLTDGDFFADRRCSPYDRRRGEEVNGAVVCGVDGSPDSQRAVAVAAQFARRLRAKLILANVVAYVSDPVVPAYAYAPMAHPATPGPPMSERRTDIETEASEALLERIAGGAGVEGAELRTMLGIPAEQLAELAEEEKADLIVVGSRGRGAFKAAFLGSVSNSLIGIAGCPVLVVPRGVTEAGPAYSS